MPGRTVAWHIRAWFTNITFVCRIPHTPLQELFNGKTLRNSKNAGRIRAKSGLFVLKKGKIAFKSRKT